MASTSRIASSLSNAGGSSGKGLSRSNPRANSTVQEGNSPSAMKGGARRNGTMAGAASNSGDSSGSDDFLGPKYSTNKDFRPSKSGGAR